MFNDPYGLTDAVLKGRKTMKRSILDYEKYKKTWDDMCRLGAPFFFTFDDFLIKRISRYQVGEVVAVAQSYKDLKLSYIPHIDEPDFKTCTKHAPQWGNPRGMKGWSNKRFVRADLMPHQICITDVNVERLQNISDEDLEKEGVEVRRYEKSGNEYVFYHPNPYRNGNWGYVHYYSLQDAGLAFFDSICGKGTWESNPLVFVFTFELVKKNV